MAECSQFHFNATRKVSVLSIYSWMSNHENQIKKIFIIMCWVGFFFPRVISPYIIASRKPMFNHRNFCTSKTPRIWICCSTWNRIWIQQTQGYNGWTPVLAAGGGATPEGPTCAHVWQESHTQRQALQNIERSCLSPSFLSSLNSRITSANFQRKTLTNPQPQN